MASVMPLVTRTGDSLISYVAKVRLGEVELITGAIGGVGCQSVFAESEIGAAVIVSVRAYQINEVITLLGLSPAIAFGTDSISRLVEVDCVADIIGGDHVMVQFATVKSNGRFGNFPMML